MKNTKKIGNAVACIVVGVLIAFGTLFIYASLEMNEFSLLDSFDEICMGIMIGFYPALIIEVYRRKNTGLYSALKHLHVVSQVLSILGVWIVILVIVVTIADTDSNSLKVEELFSNVLFCIGFFTVPAVAIELIKNSVIKKEKKKIKEETEKELDLLRKREHRLRERTTAKIIDERIKQKQAAEQREKEIVREKEEQRIKLEHEYSSMLREEREGRIRAEEYVAQIREEEEFKRKQLEEQYLAQLREEKERREREETKAEEFRRQEIKKRYRLELEYREKLRTLQGEEYEKYIKEKEETAKSRNSRKKYYWEKYNVRIESIFSIDGMEGHLFEEFCADLLRDNGFENVSVTRGSGDQGVDVTAQIGGVRYAIQCKNYAQDFLSNKPIQEVSSGKKFYNCHLAAVMTNRSFTKGARELAEMNDVLLWDRDTISEMMKVLQ